MNNERNDENLFAAEDGSPSIDHDRAVEKAISESSERIRANRNDTVDHSITRRIVSPWALAVGIVVVACLGILFYRPADIPTDILRRTAADATPSDYALLDEPPSNLVWSKSISSESVVVTMFDSDGQLLWEIRSDEGAGNLDLSAAEKRALVNSGTYYWVVTTPAGAELGPYWFRVQ